MKTVSVIIPTFNNESTIESVIISVQEQTYSKLEIILIDNGSTDATCRIIKKLAAYDNRIKLLHSANGRSIARNMGLKFAKGDFIQFLDSDDILFSKKIERAVNFLNKNQDYYAYACNVVYLDVLKKLKFKKLVNYRYSNHLLAANPFPINSLIFRNAGVRLFNESYKYNEDWLFWTDNLINKKVAFSDEFDAEVRVTGNNTMVDYESMHVYQVFIRSLIKKKYKRYDVQLFIRDCHLGVQYLSFKQPNGYMRDLIEKELRFELNLMQLLLHFNFIRHYFDMKEIKDKSKYLYHN